MALAARFDLYYIRRAEYRALDYLDQQNLPEEVMHDVAIELCIMQRNIVDNLMARLGDLDRTGETAFTGSLSGYYFALAPQYGNYKHTQYNFEKDFGIYFTVTSRPSAIWDCDEMKPISNIPQSGIFDLRKYLIIGGSGYASLMRSSSFDIIESISVVKPGGVAGLILKSTSIQPLRDTINIMIATFSEIYGQAKDFARTYHSALRTLGYTNKNQVPNAFLCPPPDVMFYDMNELAQKTGGNFEELTKIYLAYLNSIGEAFDIQRGCLAGGQVTAVTTTSVITYTTVINGTTTTITTTLKTTYTYTNTTVTTITTVINGATTSYVTTITNTYTGTGVLTTTYTTTIGGQTSVITTTSIGIVYVTPAGVYVPDIFTKLQNVTVTLPGGQQEYLMELVLLDAAESITFKVGECTQLKSPITALVAYPDGKVRVVVYPGGTMICPAKIIKSGKEEVTSYTYEEKPLSEWVSDRYQLETPEFVQTKDKLGYMIELLVMMLPLILIIALIGGIKSLAEGGRFRYVKPEKMRVINPG